MLGWANNGGGRITGYDVSRNFTLATEEMKRRSNWSEVVVDSSTLVVL